MTANDMERTGKLTRVYPQDISAEVRALGDAKKTTQDGQRMASFQCELNARALTDAMIEQGDDDWHVVFGVAYGDNPKKAVAHVWTRRGDQHFDPTWSLGGPVDGFRYFALSGEEAIVVSDLHALEDLLGSWRL